MTIDNYLLFHCSYEKLLHVLQTKTENVKSGCLNLVHSWVLRHPEYRVFTDVLLTLYNFILKEGNLFVFSKHMFMHLACSNHVNISEVKHLRGRRGTKIFFQLSPWIFGITR